ETTAFCAQQTARLQGVQWPTYSPDYTPSEKLWKKIKQQDTHLHYCPPFEALTEQASHSAAFRPNGLRLLQGIYQIIFFLNARAPQGSMENHPWAHSLSVYRFQVKPSITRM